MSAPKRQLPHITEMQTSTLGDPPALPGRQQKFDNPSGMLLVSKCQLSACCLELVVLTLGRDKAPLRGPRPLKPPALPEDAYWCRSLTRISGHFSPSFRTCAPW